MKSSQTTLSMLAAAFVMALVGGVANAAIIFNSGGTAPAVDGADIANLATSDLESIKVFSDSNNVGQTFTTGSAALGYELSAYSFQHSSTSSDPKTPLTWSMRVVNALDPNNTSTIVYETGVSYPDTWVNGDWITFQLTTPLTLSANTTYGVDVEVTAGSWNVGIPYMYRSKSSVYPDGLAYTRADGDPTSISTAATREMVFHLDMAEVVPEPTSFSAILALGGLMALRRRG